MKTIYRLNNDTSRISDVQRESMRATGKFGYKIENGLLFGSREWFEAIETGAIRKYVVHGVICRVYVTGHNDYAMFDIEDDEGETAWTQFGPSSEYLVGRHVELVYVNQKFKRPSDIIGVSSKCVIEVAIDTVG